jgi:hypothetical protein
MTTLTATPYPVTMTTPDGHGGEWTDRLTDTFAGTFETACTHCGNYRTCAARWQESTHAVASPVGVWLFLCDPCNPAPTGVQRTIPAR